MDHEAAARLSDDELVATVERLTRAEREASATLVAHLAEMSRRRLHERLGYPSLYMYCIEVLRLSPDEAYDRMKAAKVSRRYPQVLGMLAQRELSLSTIRLLAPHLRRGNTWGCSTRRATRADARCRPCWPGTSLSPTWRRRSDGCLRLPCSAGTPAGTCHRACNRR
jgi:hypothetical protein